MYVLLYVTIYVHSSFAIILMGKRELIALLGLSSWCLVMVVWLFLAVSWLCLQFVILVLFDFINLTQVHNFTVSAIYFYLPSTYGIYRKFYRNFASTNKIMRRFALSY